MVEFRNYLVSLGYAPDALATKEGLMKIPLIVKLREDANNGMIKREAFYGAMLDEYGIVNKEHRDRAMLVLEESAAKVDLLPQVLSTLPKLKEKGWKLGIVTNSSHSTEHKVNWFRECGLEVEFDAIANSCEVGFSKPHPNVYLNALEMLGLRGSETYFVGHTQKELDGAKQVKMTTVRILNEETDATQSDVTLNNFADLLDFDLKAM